MEKGGVVRNVVVFQIEVHQLLKKPPGVNSGAFVL
jgi:hypothetical protein